MSPRARPPVRLAAFAMCLAVLAACVQARAATLQVSPTSLTLQSTQTADGLWLSNSGGAPVQVQVRVFRWTQHDGQEDLQPTRDLVASPPMQTLAAGQRQLLRLVRIGAPPTVETSYRILIDELPPATPAKEGITLALRYSVPVFLDPPKGAVLKPELAVRTIATGKTTVLEVRNVGSQHAQVADLAYVHADGRSDPITAGLVGYVLPAQTMRWPLPSAWKPSANGVFKARINGASAQQPLSPAAATP